MKEYDPAVRVATLGLAGVSAGAGAGCKSPPRMGEETTTLAGGEAS